MQGVCDAKPRFTRDFVSESKIDDFVMAITFDGWATSNVGDLRMSRPRDE